MKIKVSFLSVVFTCLSVLATDPIVWTPHPCGQISGAPYRKYKLFTYDETIHKILGTNSEAGKDFEITTSAQSVEKFFEEKGITQFCAGHAGDAPIINSPTAPKESDEFKSQLNTGFIAPIQQDSKLYYQKLENDLANVSSQVSVKAMISDWISKPHLQIKDQADSLTEECQKKNESTVPVCIGRAHYDYDRAREILYGEIDSTVTPFGEFQIYDYYCQKWLGDAEFSGFPAAERPGPGHIITAKVANVEHTWPQSKFAVPKEKEDWVLRKTDFHHIFPTDTEVNRIRANDEFAEVIASSSQSMKCSDGRSGEGQILGELSPEKKNHYFEPPSQHKGDVARALFYFSTMYKLEISEYQEAFLRKWHQEDPPDQREKDRNEKIYKVQGNRNPFIDHPEWVEMISDF